MRPFFLRIYRKGKRNNNPQREREQDQEQKPSSQEDKPRKAGKEIKAGAKRTKRKANTRAKGQERGQNRGQERGQKRTKEDKIEANTPQASKPPNSTRAQKPHKPRKAPSPYKYTSAPQNPPKTPFKKRNRAYLKADAGKQNRQADKRRGTRHESRTSHKSRSPAPSKLKYILNFALFGLRKSRENTKAHQRKIHFCHFLLKICPDRLKIDDRRG